MRWFQIITFPSKCTNKTKHQHLVKLTPRIQMGCSSGRNSHFELCLRPCFGLFSLNLLLPLQLQIVYFFWCTFYLQMLSLKKDLVIQILIFCTSIQGVSYLEVTELPDTFFFCLCSVNVLYTCIAMSVLWVHGDLCYFCVALLLSPGVFVLSVTGSHSSFSSLKATILFPSFTFRLIFCPSVCFLCNVCYKFIFGFICGFFAASLCCCSAV